MTNNEGKVPCKLVGEDGNAFAIIGRVSRALRENGQGDKVAEYRSKAMSGDYNNVITTSLEYVYESDEVEEDFEDCCED